MLGFTGFGPSSALLTSNYIGKIPLLDVQFKILDMDFFKTHLLD